MATLRLKTDLRCGACVESIRPLMDTLPGVKRWSADVTVPDKVLTVEGDGLTADRIGEVLLAKGYHVRGALVAESPVVEEPRSSYYPLALILGFLLGGTALMEVALGGFDAMRSMRHFMAGFFLVFAFFKLLDVPAFATAYRGYDVIARRVPAYGYVYPFIELALGAAYLANVWPMATALATVVVMGISTVGVVQALLARRTIRCACLGTVFNLPMSAVTLVEDVLMLGMAAAMLAM